ncbi:hypothetical protein [Francisella sp. SYW-2]|uniref:hypothetical protein n=1 Tax=Francisella sp. SYW-2 TaxID=2610886 RepID=UPI00123DC246|nr:hypothetical protein [Francisella sp. SYW-2]
MRQNLNGQDSDSDYEKDKEFDVGNGSIKTFYTGKWDNSNKNVYGYHRGKVLRKISDSIDDVFKSRKNRRIDINSLCKVLEEVEKNLDFRYTAEKIGNYLYGEHKTNISLKTILLKK